MAMQGISSILGGKSTSSLLSNATDKTKEAQSTSFLEALQAADASAEPKAAEEPKQEELWDRFREFVGNTLFGQTLASMRKTVDKPAYFHGGRTEEIFQQELDNHLVKHITESSAETFIRPMFEHFQLTRGVDLQA